MLSPSRLIRYSSAMSQLKPSATFLPESTFQIPGDHLPRLSFYGPASLFCNQTNLIDDSCHTAGIYFPNSPFSWERERERRILFYKYFFLCWILCPIKWTDGRYAPLCWFYASSDKTCVIRWRVSRVCTRFVADVLQNAKISHRFGNT